MQTEMFSALFLFVFAASLSPGPNNVMLLASGANFGFRRTLPHWAGIGVGFQSLILITGFGLGRIFEIWPFSLTILKVVSVLYLLWLAWRIANAAAPRPGQSAGTPLTLLQAASFQWVNPKAWTMALTSLSVYAPSDDFRGVLIVAAAFLLAFVVSGTLWVALGRQLSRMLGDPRHLRIFNWTMAALLVASLVPVLTGG
ncbi:MAG: LysE family translocator [Rhodobacter sp.]|nr:LysE family translocator [Rhodobacter sp.]